jgi:hypothetical protein
MAVKITDDTKDKEQKYLQRMIDRGIEDMEAGHELPLDKAFQKISELRTLRRDARI